MRNFAIVMKIYKNKVRLSFVAVLVVLLIAGCKRAYQYQYKEGMVWNTVYHISYKGPASLGDSISVVLDSVGKSLSVFDPSSLVSRVNASDSIKVDAMFADVYSISRKVNEESGRRYDPTLSPLITAWGFGKGHKANTDTARIDSIMQFVGIEKTNLSDGILKKKDIRVQFNFSSVAKGYGCDAIARMFRRNGVTDYLIEIGGEIAVNGESPDRGKWRISVDRPIESADSEIHESQVLIEINSGGMATSGNYRNFHDLNGVRVGHTIDRLNGRPAHTDVASATVIADCSAEADAYATALMAMGYKDGRELAERKKMPVMIILHNGNVWMSDEFKKYVTK